MQVIIDIHKAKEIVEKLNTLAQIIMGMKLSKELEKQLLNYIDEVKDILQDVELKEEK